MGEDEQKVNDETKTINFHSLKFPYLPSPPSADDRPSPPLRTLASVPFKWEEQPGKPRPCTDLIALPDPGTARIVLEPPPCRNKTPKMPSPTTVLDGPYAVGRPRFSSFRFLRESFDGDSPHGSTADQSLLGSGRISRRGFFGRGILGISSPADDRRKMTRNGSFSSSPRFTVTILERIKNAMTPWNCARKSRKERLGSKVDM